MTILRSSTITINLLTDTVLSSCTEADLLADPSLNMFALGDPASGWYVGKFATATANATPSAPYVSSYTLTDILWGVRGTLEPAEGEDLSGLSFTLLNSAIKPRTMSAGDIGRTLTYICPSSGQSDDDAERVTHTVRGESVKPLAPARVETDDDTGLAPRTADGAVLVSPWPQTNLLQIGDVYRVDYLQDDGTEIDGAYEIFKEGTPQAAMLVSYVSGHTADKYHAVTATVRGNSFSLTSAVSNARARALQKIRQPDNFVEATLRGAADMTVTFGLMAAGKDWRTGAFDYTFTLDAGGGGQTLTASEGSTVLYTEDPVAYMAAGKRFRFRLLGNKVQFFADYVDESTPPLAESVVVPNYPLQVVLALNVGSVGAGYVENVSLTTNPLPATVLTAAQQTAWYGGLKNPVRVRIRQYSGIRQVGFGFPYEGSI